MSKNIIVAEDSRTIQKIVSIGLHNAKHQIQFAESAETLFKKAKQDSADLIILDTSMPDKPGLDLCRALKTDPQFSNTPILLIGGAQSGVDEQQAKDAGAYAFLIKPFETEVLSKTVEKGLKLSDGSTPNTFSEPASQNMQSMEMTKEAGPEMLADMAFGDESPNFASQAPSLEDDFPSSQDVFSELQDEESSAPSDSSNPFGATETKSSDDDDDSFLDADFLPSSDNPFDDSEDIAIQQVTADSSSADAAESAAMGLDDNVFEEIDASENSALAEFSETASATDFAETSEASMDELGSIEVLDEIGSEKDSTEVSFKGKSSELKNQNRDLTGQKDTQFGDAGMESVFDVDSDWSEDAKDASDSSKDATASSFDISAGHNDSNLNISDDQIETIVTKVFQKVIERIAWEVVPEMAERIIREEIKRLTKD